MPRSNFKPAQAAETEQRQNIPLVHVKSRQIAAIGYEVSTGTLALQFTPKSADAVAVPVYHYQYDAEGYSLFLKAASLGNYFGTFIKPLPFKKYPAEPLPALESTE